MVSETLKRRMMMGIITALITLAIGIATFYTSSTTTQHEILFLAGITTLGFLSGSAAEGFILMVQQGTRVEQPN